MSLNANVGTSDNHIENVHDEEIAESGKEMEFYFPKKKKKKKQVLSLLFDFSASSLTDTKRSLWRVTPPPPLPVHDQELLTRGGVGKLFSS